MAEQGIIRKASRTETTRKEKQEVRRGEQDLTLHILSHCSDLIGSMHHDPLLIRLNVELFFINDMLHTRRISPNVVTRNQCLVFCTPALQHLDKVGQLTRIRAQTRGFSERGISGVGGCAVRVGMRT